MYNQPYVKKLNDNSFIVEYPNFPKDKLLLDFLPIINQFKLKGRFCLQHWQAKPKGFRQWGIYCNESKKYFSHSYDKFKVVTLLKVQTLQLDERRFNTVPTAVVLYIDASVGKEIIIE